MSMPDLLLIGDATDEMLHRLSEKLNIHALSDIADPSAWLAEHGDKISYVATNGHDGILPAYMEAMPNLKVISCYGWAMMRSTLKPPPHAAFMSRIRQMY